MSALESPGGGAALRDAVSALVPASAPATNAAGGARVLLVVDQFEELFTLTNQPAIRDRYIDALLAAARRDGAAPVHLVLVLRAGKPLYGDADLITALAGSACDAIDVCGRAHQFRL